MKIIKEKQKLEKPKHESRHLTEFYVQPREIIWLAAHAVKVRHFLQGSIKIII